jgi:hypothetical protein
LKFGVTIGVGDFEFIRIDSSEQETFKACLKEIRESLKIINRNPRFWQVDKWIAHLSEMIKGCN